MIDYSWKRKKTVKLQQSVKWISSEICNERWLWFEGSEWILEKIDWAQSEDNIDKSWDLFYELHRQKKLNIKDTF